MKQIIFISLLLLFSFKLFAQSNINVIHYKAQLMYVFVNDAKGKIDSIIPKGENITIDYDTFFKKINIAFKDVNDIPEIINLTFSSGNDSLWTMQDYNKISYRLKPADLNKDNLSIETLKNNTVISIIKIQGIMPVK